MLHPLKITGTLADETRYHIYEFMLQHKQSFTVQEIADQFHIHPNVARLHLTKLSEINVISAEFIKTGKGGRPGRVYRATKEGVALTFPKREESMLLHILLELTDSLGKEAVNKGKEIAYNQGYKEMKEKTVNVKRTNSFEEKVAILTEHAALIGYVPSLEKRQEKTIIHYTIYNCPFHAQLSTHSKMVCALHEAYLRGQTDALFVEEHELIQTGNMLHECESCHYEIHVK
ncbi:helix-turn-helix transcriptional regulator [Lysinibacillus odysseyi]|uniref:Transcriptional regulator n=1 Tax=Lysinibacillus odysseyi 34hs-1 = NBRC 100172 TaxID=1220589 RepID=A0A0A3IFI4_9BACI|nr:helix-turn-helix domain-containing protein [Lysinibacillus odysseyi]KGR81583.1 transcriptional regulator [Lysinibacillus odysseyi 34hs-1 = NBRC 100172]